jgi:F0F1-type ATP synthase membrane subunit b/b'
LIHDFGKILFPVPSYSFHVIGNVFQSILRRKINEHLDKLEEQVNGNLDTEEAKIKSEIESLLKNLNKKAVTIVMLQSKLSATQSL